MEMKKMTRGRGWAAALVLILGFGLLVTGCESDSVAPQDELPQLSEQEAAQQTALVAVGVAQVGPEILKARKVKAGPAELGVYPYTFPEGGDISGSIILEYFEGGATGSHVNWNDADYGLLYTEEGEILEVALPLPVAPDVTVLFELACDLQGPIDRDEGTATVSGPVAFATGGSVSTYTLTEVVVSGVNEFPESGVLVLTDGPYEMEVAYNGTDTAIVSIGGTPVYSIDLDTAQIFLITD